MKRKNSRNLNIHVGSNPSIVVVTDIPSSAAFESDSCMTRAEMKVFLSQARACGFDSEDFVFITPCPPIDEEEATTDSKVGKHVDKYHQEFRQAFDKHVVNVHAIITLGKWGCRQLMGRAVKITEMRGTLQEFERKAYLPLLSPREVLRFPDRKDIFDTDVAQLGSLEQCGWSVEEFRKAAQGDNYKWVFDLSDLLEDPPQAIAFDVETVGLDHRSPGFRVLTASITRKRGESLVVPLDIEWWNNESLMDDYSRSCPRLTEKMRRKLIRQLKELLGNPEVHVVGHNLKYDLHAMSTLGVEVANWYLDTIQLAFVVDENMQSKSLDNCVRRWLPQFSGYADSFNANTDKSRMDLVQHDDFLKYAGGDTEVTYRLANVLMKLAKQDQKNFETFRKVQMPALRMFYRMERRGIVVDTEALSVLGQYLKEQDKEIESRLISQCPRKLILRYLAEGKKVSFDSPKFLVDLIFGPDGIKVKDGKISEKGETLEPRVWTKSGEISTSGGDHLTYFEDIEFIRDIIELKVIRKMRSTYVGEPSTETKSPVKRLKSGGLPAAVDCALKEEGIQLPKMKGGVVRSRTPNPDLVELFNERGVSKSLDVPFGANKRLTVDVAGNVSLVTTSQNTGFWQYIREVDGTPKIFPQLWLHRVVTGRTSSSDPNCFPDGFGVEVLTKGGWLPFEDVPDDMEVAQWDCDTQTIDFALPVDRIEQEVCDIDIVKIRTDFFIDIVCTENHRWPLINRKTNKLSMVEAGSYQLDAKQPVSAHRSGGTLSLRAEQIGLICALQADGSITKDGAYDFTFRKRRKARRLVHWLKAAGIPYKDYTVEGRFRYFIHQDDIPQWLRSRGKRFSWEVLEYDRETLGMFCDELWQWDGGYTRRKTWTSTVRQNADIVQAAFSLNGDRATVHEASNENCESFWVVNVTHGCTNVQTANHTKEIEKYTGTIRCFTMPKGTLVVRRNGKVAITGNSQNFPKRGVLAERFREVFLAESGKKLIEVDLSQAEIRVVAAMAGEREMLRIYNNDGDIHTATAAFTMGVSESQFIAGLKDETPLIEVVNAWPGAEQYLQRLHGDKRRTETVAKYCKYKRFCAKAVNFGFIYGMGWRNFKSYARTDFKIDYSDAEAEEVRERFFEKYSRLQPWHEAMREFLNRNGYVRALHGALRRLPNSRSDDDKIVGVASRQGINSPVQRFASDYALMGAIRFDRDADPDVMGMYMFIHDANIATALEDHAEEAASALKWYMESTPLKKWFGIELPVKMVADASIGTSLGSIEERPDIESKKPSWFSGNEAPNWMAEDLAERWMEMKEFGVIIPG